MKEELEIKLVEKYPNILQDYRGDERHTCMAWGFEHADGWYKLIDDLLGKIDAIAKVTGMRVVADQIKEKFGTLRFYYHIENSDKYDQIWNIVLRDIINAAEIESGHTCEFCGKRGKLNTTGWWKVYCEDCKK